MNILRSREEILKDMEPILVGHTRIGANTVERVTIELLLDIRGLLEVISKYERYSDE